MTEIAFPELDVVAARIRDRLQRHVKDMVPIGADLRDRRRMLVFHARADRGRGISAPIEVIEVRRLTDEGNLRGVRQGQARLHRHPRLSDRAAAGQKAWVALPQTPARKKADGSSPCLEITNKQVMQAITRAVVEAWEAGG